MENILPKKEEHTQLLFFMIIIQEYYTFLIFSFQTTFISVYMMFISEENEDIRTRNRELEESMNRLKGMFNSLEFYVSCRTAVFISILSKHTHILKMYLQHNDLHV